MSLNKKKMVREIGRRTSLKNREVQVVIETLIEVWTEEFVSGGRIEIENFIVLECQETSHIVASDDDDQGLSISRRVRVTTSKRLRQRLQL